MSDFTDTEQEAIDEAAARPAGEVGGAQGLIDELIDIVDDREVDAAVVVGDHHPRRGARPARGLAATSCPRSSARPGGC